MLRLRTLKSRVLLADETDFADVPQLADHTAAIMEAARAEAARRTLLDAEEDGERNVAGKNGMAVVTTPDAGQNCMVVPANVRARFYATVDLCSDPNGVIPASCSTTAVSTGMRFSAGSPEQVPMTNATFVQANGSPWSSGTKYIKLCALPTSTSGVLEYTPYVSCNALP